MDKEAVFGLLGIAVVLFILVFKIPACSALVVESDIETIREAQRECLKREPAHSFSLVQAQGGYRVQCEPL